MTEEYDDALPRNIAPMLLEIATSEAIEGLASIVVQMRANGTEGRSIVNSTMMVEIAAERRSPAEIAELVEQFHQQTVAEDLSRLALDAAAAQLGMTKLAELIGALVVRDLAGQADMLISSVVRRRLPRHVAELLSILDTSGQKMLAVQLIDKLGEDDGRVFVVLWLRASERFDLAEQLSARMAENLGPADLADFIKDLGACKDAAGASTAVRGALGRDLDEVALLIEHLRSGTGKQDAIAEMYARSLLDQAPGVLEISDLFVLASLLGARSWKEGADIIWDAVLPGLKDDEFVDKLEAGIKRGYSAGMLDALRKAAETHSVERIAGLAVEVQGRIVVEEVAGVSGNGYDTLLDTVAAYRSIDEVFHMADELDKRGHGRVTTDLLRRVEKTVHQRKNGADAAEFIDRTLSKDGEPKGRVSRRTQDDRIHAIVTHVVEKNNPEQLMGMIAELTKRRRYDQCHRWVELEVAQHHDAALLAALPLVHRRDYLPAVLDIIVPAFRTPKWTKPVEIPHIIQALKDSGASQKDLESLLTYTGSQRDLDYSEITNALTRSGLRDEAQWVQNGRSKKQQLREPHFWS